VYADRGYDSDPHRAPLRRWGIEPIIGRRRTGHGSGLGVFRWVAERAIAWLHGFRKLRLVTEKTEDMQYAFLNLAHVVILWRLLQLPFC
jgi:transposase